MKEKMFKRAYGIERSLLDAEARADYWKRTKNAEQLILEEENITYFKERLQHFIGVFLDMNIFSEWCDYLDRAREEAGNGPENKDR